MEPYIQSYFSKSITRGVNENGDVSDGDENGEEFEDVKQKTRKNKTANGAINVTQICELIYELNHICSSIVQGKSPIWFIIGSKLIIIIIILTGILPHIEFKLKSNEERERCEYTKLLARLFSDKNTELATKYPEVWKSFLGRFRDISITVRMRCVQYSMHFLVNHPDLRKDITEQLKQRQHDADENVRYEVVMAIISAGKKGIENINEDLLGFVKVCN